MAIHSSVHMFRTEPWGHVGVMGGANSLNIMEDLGREGLQVERAELLDEIKKCNEVFLEVPYPYSSEYPVDTTAQEQIYFFTRNFGNTEKNHRTVQVMRALRGGNQPVWFQYGNDNKGDLTCWYTESTNGWALLRAFEDAGDLDTLIKGFAGVMSVAVALLPDGMCFAHFLSTPGIFDFTPPRTLDGGIAQFGFLKAAKAYVIQDDSFGSIGFGCRVESSTEKIRVHPQDGLRKRLRFVPQGIDLEVAQGEIDWATLIDDGRQIELSLSDSTQVVKEAKFEIKGLPSGDYRVRPGGLARRRRISDSLQPTLPIVDEMLIEIEKL